MNTKTPRKLAAILAAALLGGSSALVSAAQVAPRTAPNEAATALPGSDHVVDKAGDEALQVLIFIHRSSSLPKARPDPRWRD